jgi:hypothetical protein
MHLFDEAVATTVTENLLLRQANLLLA